MTRAEFEQLVFDTYGIRADYPFEDDLVTGVFRHGASGKWFALAMNISACKLLSDREGRTDVVNLKCAPEVIESLAGIERGIYPAYHMNKTHWLSVDLAECEPGNVAWLLDISFELTAPRRKGGTRVKN